MLPSSAVGRLEGKHMKETYTKQHKLAEDTPSDQNYVFWGKLAGL